MAVLDYLAEIGLDVVNEKIKDARTEAAARDRLTDFLQRQSKLNFNCSIEEEIDFQGLSDYIRQNLINDVKLRLFGTRKERKCARQTIVGRATHYAQTKTKISEKRAQEMVGKAVDILAIYYRGKVNRDLLFVATEVEDTIIDEMTVQHQEISKQIDYAIEKIDSAALLSIDSNLSMARAGHLDLVEENFSTAIKAISSTHSLFPYYGYKMEDQDNLISIPLTEDATKLFPPRFNITVSSVRVGNKNVSRMDSSILSQAYNHQLPIHIDVVEAKKYLGDVLDPIQSEVEEMVGAHVVMKPPEFPEAFPCNVSVDENIVVEYLFLRTKEIHDDGTVIITNEEQKNFNFNVTLTLNPLTHRLSFSIKPSNPTNAESLRYRMFLKRASLANKVSLKVLSLGIALMEGKPDPIDLCLLDSEIEFLEKIVAIEKYFEIEFHIPEEITLEDHKTIDHIYSMIKLGSYKGKWDKFDFAFIVSDDLRQKIAI